MRAELVEQTRTTLTRAGFELSVPTVLRPVSFDVVARKGDVLLLVKVFTNADSLSEPLAAELRTLAQLLRASPLLIGERSSAGALEDGVLYLRHRVPLVTPATLEGELLRDEPALVYAAPGGYYVNVDGPMLRGLREHRQLSLGQIAEVAGVSRRAIAMYEEGMGALVEVVERLEGFFEEPLVRPVEMFQAPPQDIPDFDPATPREALERDVLALLSGLGYHVVPTGRSLFDAVGHDPSARGREASLLLAGVGDLDAAMADKARALQSIGSIAGTHFALIVRDRKSREHLEGAPLIGRDELSRMGQTEDIVALMRKRATQA